MQKEKVCIVIPVYQKKFTIFEKTSILQGLRTFQNYDIYFICPISFDESTLDNFRELHSRTKVRKFENRFFKSANSYNELLLKKGFYDIFKKYEFMLIYQTDAYVFKDELEYWCNQNIDYLGAPWFKDFDKKDDEIKFLPTAGNGGFSLRNISKIRSIMHEKLDLKKLREFRKILKKTRAKPKFKFLFDIIFYLRFLLKKNSLDQIIEYVCKNMNCPNEDYFFAWIYPSMFPNLRVATAEEAIPFAFECQPEKLYKLNQNNIPFGCHAWQKYSPEFWKKLIKIEN